MTLSPDPVESQLVTARRHQILDAAAKVFADKGFHLTTVKEIAVEAGVAPGTIYNYFENKPALLIGLFHRMKASALRENTPFDSGETDFRASMKSFLRLPLMGLKDDNFTLFRIVVSEMMVNEDIRKLYYEQVLEPTLALGEAYLQEQGVRCGISPERVTLTIRAISAMIMGLMLEHVIGDAALAARWEELPDFLTDLLLDGIKK